MTLIQSEGCETLKKCCTCHQNNEGKKTHKQDGEEGAGFDTWEFASENVLLKGQQENIKWHTLQTDDSPLTVILEAYNSAKTHAGYLFSLCSFPTDSKSSSFICFTVLSACFCPACSTVIDRKWYLSANKILAFHMSLPFWPWSLGQVMTNDRQLISGLIQWK